MTTPPPSLGSEPLLSRRSALSLLLFLPACGLTAAILWLDRAFGIVTLDSILFTMTAPLAGVSPDMVLSGLAFTGLALVMAAACAVLARMARRRAVSPAARRIVRLLPALALIAALIFAFAKYRVVAYIIDHNTNDAFISEHYADVAPEDVVFPARKRNMVLLVLESMENTFAGDLFDRPLIPRLAALRDQNVAFKNQKQAEGTSWSIAGLTSYLFGLPLLLPLEINSYSHFQTFLPHATSVLDLADHNGYHVSLIAAGDAEFSGTSHLFSSHARDLSLYDKSTFLAALPPDDPNVKARWGVRDSHLYRQARDIIAGQGASGKPFFTVVLSSDTHTPAISYGEFPPTYNDSRDSFLAADRMAADFIAWLQAQPFADDTVIVVLGDHFYMAEKLGPVALPAARRDIYNAFLNTGRTADPADAKRTFASFDIAPTLIEALGAVLPGHRFGLGVSLFSSEPTLLERYGLDAVNQHLKRRSERYRAFF